MQGVRGFCSLGYLFKHFCYGSLELLVFAAGYGFRIVVYSNVWLKLQILEISAVGNAPRTYLRYAEYKRRIHLILPPHGSGGAGNGCADDLACAESPVAIREAAGVGIIGFADHDAGRFHPFVVRLGSHVDTPRLAFGIHLSVKEGG